jgi:hypothetical protein
MFIANPSQIQKVAQWGDKTPDGTAMGIRIGRESNLGFLEDRELTPTGEQYAAAAAVLSEMTELDLSAEQVKDILALYPRERIIIARTESNEELEEADISFVAAHFFLNCSWPIYGDEVDMTAFIDLLKSEAIRMGYRTAELTDSSDD